MNLVAASRLQKTKTQTDNIRPMYNNIKRIIDDIKSCEGIEKVVFAQQREVKNAVYILMTSDRGLCGGYNVNVSKEALAHINAHKDVEASIITIGSKGWEYFKRRGKNILHRYPAASESTAVENAEAIGKIVADMYKSGEADEVYLVYTHFESILSHIPYIVKLLPISAEPDDQAFPGTKEYEPDIHTFLDSAVPMYLNMYIYGAMMESAVCEQAARMTSMDAASRNATAIIDELTLEYNRNRQGMITQEITEIVSGANALQ